MEFKSIAEFYAEVLAPVADQALHLRRSPVTWDGEALTFVNAPSVRVVPGEFHIDDVKIEGLRICDWLEKQAAATHA